MGTADRVDSSSLDAMALGADIAQGAMTALAAMQHGGTGGRAQPVDQRGLRRAGRTWPEAGARARRRIGQPMPGAQVARAAAYLMPGQVEAGTLCLTAMTFAVVPLLQREPAGVIDYSGDWLPTLYSREFDGADAPLARKRGALIGMGLTEKQGGSDLLAVPTRAMPLVRRVMCPASWRPASTWRECWRGAWPAAPAC